MPADGWTVIMAEALVPVSVKVAAVRDEIVDGNSPPEVMTGREVTASPEPPPERPVLLWGLSPRPVTPRAVSRRLPVSLFEDKVVQLGTSARLEVQSQGTGGFKLVLFSQRTRQVLYRQEAGDTEGWKLIWVGDLDGDRALDLLLAADSNANVSTYRLFLSSETRPGGIVREVATFTRTGC